MGCGSSRAAQGKRVPRAVGTGEIDKLESDTRFSKDELELLSRRFYEVATLGEMTLEEFAEVMSSAGLPQYSESFVDRVFHVFDADKSGTVSLRELCTGLSVLSHGTPEEKLNMSFNVYDINGDGLISSEEFTVLLSSLESGMVLTGKENVSQVVEQFLKDFDVNADEMISLHEFKLAALKEPLFRELLESPADSPFDSSGSSPPVPQRNARRRKGDPPRSRAQKDRDSRRRRRSGAGPSTQGSGSNLVTSLSSCSDDNLSSQASARSSNATQPRGRGGAGRSGRRRRGRREPTNA